MMLQSLNIQHLRWLCVYAMKGKTNWNQISAFIWECMKTVINSWVMTLNVGRLIRSSNINFHAILECRNSMHLFSALAHLYECATYIQNKPQFGELINNFRSIDSNNNETTVTENKLWLHDFLAHEMFVIIQLIWYYLSQFVLPFFSHV